MWLLRNYEAWLEFTRELLNPPLKAFPRIQLQQQLSSTLDTIVSWNWEDCDGSYGMELSHPIDGWPTAADYELWDSGVRHVHPLLCWFRITQDPRPMSLGRVPDTFVAAGARELTRELTVSAGVDQQLSIPCYADRHGHRAFVAAQSGDDFCDEALQLARLIHPLIALLWLQTSVLERCPGLVDGYALSGRERAVLQLLADGLTADAIARRLTISPRTVHAHLGHIYRKLGVSDRMRAVIVAEGAGLVSTTGAGNVAALEPRDRPHGLPRRASSYATSPRSP